MPLGRNRLAVLLAAGLTACGAGGGNSSGPPPIPATTAQSISAPVPASGTRDVGDPFLAFNDAGDGMAVWTTAFVLPRKSPAAASTGNLRLEYSTFSAVTERWSPPAVLAENAIAAALTSDGAGFLAAWSSLRDHALHAAVFDNTTWTTPHRLVGLPVIPWQRRFTSSSASLPSVAARPGSYAVLAGGVVAVFEDGVWFPSEAVGLGAEIEIAASDDGYAIAWGGGFAVSARVWQSGTWLPATEVLEAHSFNSSKIVSDGTSYSLLGIENGALVAAIYSNGTWTTTLLESSPFLQVHTRIQCAWRGGYAFAWRNTSSPEIRHATLATGGTLQGPAAIPGSNAGLPRMAGVSGRIVLTWHSAPIFGQTTLLVSQNLGSGWSTPTELGAGLGPGVQDIIVTPQDAAVIMSGLSGSPATLRYWVSEYTAGLWQPAVSPSLALGSTRHVMVPVRSGAGQYASLEWSSRPAVNTAQPPATLRAHRFSAGSWQSPTEVWRSGPAPATWNTAPRIVFDNAGEARVIWASGVDGDQRLVSRRTDLGFWQPTEELVPAPVSVPEVATDPAGNIVVAYDAGGYARTVDSRTGWEIRQHSMSCPPIPMPFTQPLCFGIQPPVVAMDETSFVVAAATVPFARRGELRADIVDPSGSRGIGGPPGNAPARYLITTVDQGYAMLHDSSRVGPALWLEIYDGNTWASEMVDDLTGVAPSVFAFGSRGDEYAVVWTRDSDVHAKVYRSGTLVQDLTIVTATSFEGQPALATEGARWVAAWIDDGDVYAAIIDASGASAPVRLEPSTELSRSVGVIGRANGFDAVWVQQEPLGNALRRQRFENGSWSPRDPIVIAASWIDDVDLAVDAAGALSATWTDRGQVWASVRLPD